MTLKTPSFSRIRDVCLMIGAIGTVISVGFLAYQIRESRLVESARFVLEIGQQTDTASQNELQAAIEGTSDAPHPENYPLLKTRGGRFTTDDIDTYLGPYDDVAILWKVIDEQMAYDSFSYDVEKAWCNTDVQSVVALERRKSGDTSSSQAFWMPLQKMTEHFLRMDGHVGCTGLDTY